MPIEHAHEDRLNELHQRQQGNSRMADESMQSVSAASQVRQQ